MSSGYYDNAARRGALQAARSFIRPSESCLTTPRSISVLSELQLFRPMATPSNGEHTHHLCDSRIHPTPRQNTQPKIQVKELEEQFFYAAYTPLMYRSTRSIPNIRNRPVQLRKESSNQRISPPMSMEATNRMGDSVHASCCFRFGRSINIVRLGEEFSASRISGRCRQPPSGNFC